MVRPVKCRQICHFPETLEFVPKGEFKNHPITITIDEYETIRLIDKEGLSQEECGLQLGVGRTTAQKIYDNARKKIADALVLGLPLKIEGGQFHLCNGNPKHCYKDDCLMKQILTDFERNKGEDIVRVAVTYEDGMVFQHFGRTAFFKVYDIENGEIVSSEVVDNNGIGHGALVGILTAMDVDVLICGGIGPGAQNAMASAGIELFPGVSGNADDVVKDFAAGHLAYDPDAKCDHHDHHGEGCGHGTCH
ncbi:MAG: DUF134 domain-containing protein [Erysipelotrichaceae bacterium]|nr:DUF134 domain-containing protein [Erysipelotrichaceae bacterium]